LTLFREQLVGGNVFVGFENYARAFGDELLWTGIGRVGVFFLIQVPIMLVFALAFRARARHRPRPSQEDYKARHLRPLRRARRHRDPDVGLPLRPRLRICFQVVLRLLAPGFATVLLFALVHTWNNYFLPLIMLNDPELYPITVGLARWQGQAAAAGGASGDLIPLVITGSLLSIIPLVIAFLFLQRYWQSGLVAGAVKQ
jgi:hypothetical protein